MNDAYAEAVEQETERNGGDRKQAHRTVTSRDPESCAAYLRATDPNRSNQEPEDMEDAKAEYEEAVEQEMERNGGDRRKACATVARRDPDLHEAYLRATNPRTTF